MKKYRARVFDVMMDLWVIEERKFLIFWIFMGMGPRSEIEKKVKELNG